MLPSKLLTLSTCLAPFLPDAWSYSWAEMSEAERLLPVEQLGLPSESLWRWVNEMTVGFDAGDVAWPHVIRSFDVASEIFLRLPIDREWRLLEIGLHVDDVDGFVRSERWASPSPPGIVASILERQAIRTGGVALGFEVLGSEQGTPHSWLCNGLENDAATSLGVRPNASGLLSTLDAARRASRYFNDERLGEPVTWFPWLVVDLTSAVVTPERR